MDSPKEAIRALCANKPGFADAVRGMELKVVRSKRGASEGLELDLDELSIGISNGDIHVIPMPMGSKSGGIGKIIIGIVMIAAIIYTGGGAAALLSGPGAWGAAIGNVSLLGGALSGSSVALMGGAMIAGGIASMLAPTPNTNTQKDHSSMLFNGVENVAAQGSAVPLVYGLTLTGSVVISVGMSTEQINVNTGGTYTDGSYYNDDDFGGADGSTHHQIDAGRVLIAYRI